MQRLGLTVKLGAYCSIELSQLSPDTLAILRREFTFTNPAYQKAKAIGRWAGNEPNRYYSYTERHGCLNVWRGGAKRLRAILEDLGHEITWVDERLKFGKTGLTLGTLKPRENQLEMAKKMVVYQQGIAVGKTGMGKTETGLTAIVLSQQPALVVVWNKDLLAQWIERIVKYGILPKNEIGIIQGPKNKYGLITIAMNQSLYGRVNDWVDKFGVLVMDECQRAPARTFIEGLVPFPAKYRWGLSADPERRDKKHFLGYECFGYQSWQLRTKTLKYDPIAISQGQDKVLSPKVKIISTEYEDLIYEEERNFGALINRMVVDEARNALIQGHLKAELESGSQCVLFTDRVESAVYWADLVSSWGIMAGALIGGTENSQETKSTIQLLKEGKCRFAAATSYGDVGLDIPSLEAAFLTCPGTNDKRITQQAGRVLREFPGKKKPRVYYFWDKHVEGISKHIKKIRKMWSDVEEIDSELAG